MINSKGTSDRDELRRLIKEFVSGCLDEKRNKNSDEEARSELRMQQEIHDWVADAAKRVKQLKRVTHIIKTMHPDARGTQLCFEPEGVAEAEVVNTRSVPRLTHDVVGNAAAQDVYAFLSLQLEGRTIFERMEDHDEDLIAILSNDRAEAISWIDSFLQLKAPPKKMSSHTLAKQVYWLTGNDATKDDQYHLLAPLYASSLSHFIYDEIQKHRFSEDAKAARQARKEGTYSEVCDYEYPRLAVQKFGGSNPQNISKLNSVRHGQSYLLASLPPIWKTSKVRPPYGRRSLFEQFGARRAVAPVVSSLKKFLESDPPKTIDTRKKVDALVMKILDQVHIFVAELATLEAGWSADERCRLNEAQKLWLDPNRVEIDADFAAATRGGEWQKSVARSFAHWLNDQLGEKLPVGDVEHSFWMDMFEDYELRMAHSPRKERMLEV